MSHAALLALAAIAAAHGARINRSSRPIVVAECGLANGRAATVTRIGDRYAYAFARNGRREISLDADPRDRSVFKRVDTFPRAGSTHLRFVSGDTSYVLFRYFNLGNYVRGYEGATEVSGLLVLRGGRRLVGEQCRTGDGLEDPKDVEALPDDPSDLLDDILAVVERPPAARLGRHAGRARRR